MHVAKQPENDLFRCTDIIHRDIDDDDWTMDPLGGFPRLTRAEYETKNSQACQYEALLFTDDYQKIMTAVRFFRELFTASKIDPRYHGQALLKTMFTLVQKIRSEEIMHEFAYVLFNFYSHGVSPIPEFIAWAEDTILRITEISKLSMDFLTPFILLLEETHAHAQCLLNVSFFKKLALFIGRVPVFDKLIVDLLIAYASNSNLPNDAYIGFLIVVDVLLVSPTLADPDVALNTTNIIYETLSALDEQNSPILEGIYDGIIAKMQLLWNMNQDVNDNMFMIMQLLPAHRLAGMLNEHVVAILNQAALQQRNCEAILLIGVLAKTHRHWDPILPELSRMVFDGTYSVATAAGAAMAGFMEGNPALFYEAFSTDFVDSEMSPNPMNYVRATSRALSLQNMKAAWAVMHGLESIYRFFWMRDADVHAFTEMLDDGRYDIRGQIEEYFGMDDEDISRCSERLLYVIEGKYTDDML